MPSSAWRPRFLPSKWKGLVTTPTVSAPSSRAIARDDRRAAGAGAAAHAGGDEHHVGAGEQLADALDVLGGGLAADLGIGAGAEALREVPCRAAASPARGSPSSACASVLAAMKSTPWQAGRDHRVDRVAAAAADADDLDPCAQLVAIRQLDHQPTSFTLAPCGRSASCAVCAPRWPVTPPARVPAASSCLTSCTAIQNRCHAISPRVIAIEVPHSQKKSRSQSPMR